MTKFTFEGTEYDTSNLSDNGKAQMASLQFLETHMATLKSKIAVFQTAKNIYSKALQDELEKIKK